MRIIDRLYQYLDKNHISFYSFEKKCGIANGYLQKQKKGKGSIGSEILEKISSRYPDLSLIWLVTGRGHMTGEQVYPEKAETDHRLGDPGPSYSLAEQTIQLLHEKIAVLENTIRDKEKIIQLLEHQMMHK